MTTLEVVEPTGLDPEKFRSWGSTERFHKGLFITEKIDGTNGCIAVGYGKVVAQSRKRSISPDNDNHGFAAWVHENAGVLEDTLGIGYHYGEWYGTGIQGNPLGIEGRSFGLFNAWHWGRIENLQTLRMVPGLTVVPTLFDGTQAEADIWTIPDIVMDLKRNGSMVWGADKAAKAEGVIVWHRGTNTRYKILIENDSQHKWEQAGRVA
jgi:hypothetical protein